MRIKYVGAIYIGVQEKIKGSNLITLEGTGHELHVDDWKSIIDGIEKHIND